MEPISLQPSLSKEVPLWLLLIATIYGLRLAAKLPATFLFIQSRHKRRFPIKISSKSEYSPPSILIFIHVMVLLFNSRASQGMNSFNFRNQPQAAPQAITSYQVTLNPFAGNKTAEQNNFLPLHFAYLIFPWESHIRPNYGARTLFISPRWNIPLHH